MKKFSFLSLFLLALAFTSCEKDKIGDVHFNVYPTQEFTIPPNTILDIPAIVIPSVSTNWSSEYENNNTNKDRLKEMKLQSFKLVIKDPPGKTFKFIKDIDIFITADGLQETKIAYLHDIDDNVGQTLDLNPVDVNLVEYAKSDSFNIRVKVNPDEYNADYVKTESQLNFLITANVL